MAFGSDTEDNLDAFDDTAFYPPSPPPTTQTYATTSLGSAITLHLVGHSALEAHRLWNGARVVAEHLEQHPSEVRGRTVLELGAGAGLPSLVAAALGAAKVVVTDFPDPDLVATMQRNVAGCALIPATAGDEDRPNIVVRGYVWGADAQPLLSCLDSSSCPDSIGPKFDVLILADLLFRHSEHQHLLDTVSATLGRRRGTKALVVFTSYRPWLAHKDVAFFDLARARGFVVDELLERKMDRPLFEDDPGDEEVRRTVRGYALRWPTECCDEEDSRRGYLPTNRPLAK